MSAKQLRQHQAKNETRWFGTAMNVKNVKTNFSELLHFSLRKSLRSCLKRMAVSHQM
jgi:hypothetical protein